MASLDLKLLGGFVAHLPSGQVVQISGKKNQALLSYLAFHRGKPVTREKLVGILWSDRADGHARNSLRQALVALRRDLAGVDPSPLLIEGDSLAIDPMAVSVDVSAFERLAATTEVDDLRHAAGMYAGDLLDGIAVHDRGFEEWLAVERNRLRLMAITALDQLAGSLSGSEAIEIANRLIVLDPLRETSHRSLMRAYAAQGQGDQAIKQYQVCRNLLRQDLQVEPSRETEDLHRAISEGRYQSPVSERERPVPRVDKPALPSANRPSIAVLPFVNLSGDPEQRYFSDGVTEDIITELSRFQSLSVIARNSSFQFRDRSVDVRQIGRDLGAQYIVEGSVRRAGDRLRVTAQLVDASTGNQIWAEHYDRDQQDIFAVQDEVTRMIAATAAGRVESVDVSTAKRSSTKSPAAYDHVLRARGMRRAAYFDTSYFVQGAVESAREMLQTAIQIDPNYPRAHAELAWTYIDEWFTLGKDENPSKAFRCAQTAAQLDPSDSNAQRTLGMTLLWLRKYDEAGSQLEKAVSINPNDVMAAQNLAVYLDFIGRSSDAKVTMQNAMRLDPHYYYGGIFRETLGYALYNLGQYGEALVEFGSLNPKPYWVHAYLAACYAQLDRMEEARAEASIFLEDLLPTSNKLPVGAITIDRESRLHAIRAYMGTYKQKTDSDRWFNAMRKAGIPV